MTDAEIIAIRDEHLPSQGEPFDCLAFGRAIAAAALAQQQARIKELETECDKWYSRGASLALFVVPEQTPCGVLQEAQAKWDAMIARAEKAEAALRQAVPREPTEAMILACPVLFPYGEHTRGRITAVWRAMYDAAQGAKEGGAGSSPADQTPPR